MSDIDRRLAAGNPVDGQERADASRNPQAVALLQRVLAEPVSAPRRLRFSRRFAMRRAAWGVGLAAATAMIVALALVLSPASPTRGPSGASVPRLRLVVFRSDGDQIIARITDPSAAAEQLTAVFKAHGLNIQVQTLPVSPSLVGTIVYSDVSNVQSLQAGPCMSGGGTGCDVGLVIPADFSGEAYVSVGRAAAPGEDYASSADVFAPGEVLHCSGILGQSTSTTASTLQEMGVTVRWDVQPTGSGSVPDGYVVSGTAMSSTTVLLNVSPQLLDTSEFDTYQAAVNQGCKVA